MSTKLKVKAGSISGKAQFSQAITEISKEAFSTMTVIENGTKLPDISLESVLDFALAYSSTITEKHNVLLEYSTSNLKSIPEIKDVDYNSLFDLDFKNDQERKLNYANFLYETIVVWEDEATYVLNNISEFDDSTQKQAEIHLSEIKRKKEIIEQFIRNCRDLENNSYLSKINECEFKAFNYKRKLPSVPTPTPTVIPKPHPQITEHSRVDSGDRGCMRC